MKRFSSIVLVLSLLAMRATGAMAEMPALAVNGGWTPAQSQAGGDTPLYMRIDNPNGEDALLRARCPVANFVELRVLDRGEGVPSPRAVKRITVPAGGSLALDPDGPRIMLLQTTQPLPAGARFTCRLTFMNAGPIDVEFKVDASGSASAR